MSIAYFDSSALVKRYVAKAGSQWVQSFRYNALDVAPRTIEAAKRLANRHPLRAYDAVQLASALLANEELTRSRQPSLIFVCADERLLTIALDEGLLTANPNHHP